MKYVFLLRSNGDIIKRKQSEEILLFNIKNVTEQQQPQQLLKDDKTNKIDIISIPVNSVREYPFYEYYHTPVSLSLTTLELKHKIFVSKRIIDNY